MTLREDLRLEVPLVSCTLLENYIETGSEKTPSKVDIGPVLSVVSSNPVDGLRMRIGAKTTAHLMPHFFVEGYLARGKKSHKTYYEAKATWSLNRKAYLPHEFPMRTLSVSSAYDVAAASDRYLRYGKDNVFQVIRSNPTELMYFYKRQAADFTWETAYGLRASLGVKLEKTMPAGRLTYTRLADGVELPKMRTTEVSLSLNYQPGQTFITSKEQRFEASRNAALRGKPQCAPLHAEPHRGAERRAGQHPRQTAHGTEPV